MQSEKWLERQRQKLRLGFAAIESATGKLGPSLGLPHITYACMLFFIEQHKLFEGWRESFPKLAAWYDAMRKQPALAATEPKLA
jgi:glutathione S-transferase